MWRAAGSSRGGAGGDRWWWLLPFSSTVQRHRGLLFFFPSSAFISILSTPSSLFCFFPPGSSFFFPLLFPSSVLFQLSKFPPPVFRLCLRLIYLPKTIPPLKRPQLLLFISAGEREPPYPVQAQGKVAWGGFLFLFFPSKQYMKR